MIFADAVGALMIGIGLHFGPMGIVVVILMISILAIMLLFLTLALLVFVFNLFFQKKGKKLKT